MLSANEEKLKIFYETARALNEAGIVPVLYGSLGLYRGINELKRKVNDIDVLVSDELTGEKWKQLRVIMEHLGFTLQDEHEHEFIRHGEVVAFGRAGDLVKFAGVDQKDMKITSENGARFKELSPEQYLRCYKLMLRDNYRQEKRGNADKEKIALIESYFQNLAKA